MPPRDPPPPTGFPPVTPEDSLRARQETSGSVGGGGEAIPDALAIVHRHRTRITAASAIAPEMCRVALDILDAVIDDLRAPREAGSRS